MSDFVQGAWHECPVEPEGDTAHLTPRHQALFSHVRALEEDQMDVHASNMLNARLYSNREPMSFQWNSALTSSIRPLTPNTDNVIQAVVDTLVARIGSMKPKATIYTRGADFSVYRRGRALDKYLWGEFQSLGIHRMGRQVFRDALVYGTGFIKIGVDRKRKQICAERVNPDEVIIDQRECVSNQQPGTYHHRRLVSRMALKKLYPKYTATIDDAQVENFQYTSYRTPAAEQIVLIETWKLPSCHGAGDGLYDVSIENATLHSSKYTHDKPPLIPLKWSDPLTGFYGRSVVGDLVGYQVRLNKLNFDIEWGQDVMCVPRVFVDQGSAFTGTRLDNDIGKEIRYRGVKPEVEVWPAFNPEIYNERERTWTRAHESQGVSERSVGSKMPEGWRADSSEAQREQTSYEDERFNDRVQALEEWYLDVAREIIRCSADLFENESFSNTTKFRSANVVQQIDWKDCDLDADKYVMQIAASSVLNMSPAARRDKINFWLDRQLVTPEQYKGMSGEPDLEAISQLQAANNDAISNMIEKMLDGDTGQSPDPHMNLAMAIEMVNNSYLHIKSLDAPEGVQQIFRVWLLTAESLVNQPVPAAPSGPVMGPDGLPGMPAPGMPPGAPMSAGPPGPPGMGVPPMLPGGMQ
jgi:hypothetical protein